MLVTTDILITDRFSIFRTKFNELLDEFGDFVFDPYSGALSFENDLEITGTLDVTGNTILDADLTVDGEAYFDGTFLNLNWGNTSIVSGGLRVDRGTGGADAVLAFYESDDLWKVGLYGGSFTALSLVGHTHDDRYFTETEITTNHYTKTAVDTLFTSYYTSAQVDTLLTSYYDSSTIDTMLDSYFNIPSTVVGTGLKVYTHSADVLDNGSFNLPAITNNGFGWVTVGDNAERSHFSISSIGAVILLSNTANVIQGADTDNKFCIGTAATQEPLVIKNALGGTRRVNLILWYD
jgi:hypothetical protein